MRFVHIQIVFLLCLLISIGVDAQREDFHWCLGYNGELGSFTPPNGGIDFQFFDDSIRIKYARRVADFDDCNANICDEHGELLIYTNGIYAANGKNQRLINGGGLDEWSSNGNQARQGAMILPMPGAQRDTFIIIHNHMEIFFVNAQPVVAILDLFSSKVDLAPGLDDTNVFDKKKIILQDTIKWGLTAVRHANGRDWWMPAIRDQGDFGYMLLIEPSGVSIKDTFTFDDPWIFGSGQVHFTPDGTKYVQAFSKDITEGYYLDVLDFDRCNGTFSNRQQVFYQDTQLLSIGGAISANSRYAYVAAFDEIHQYDLWSDDLEGSRIVVAEEDGFETIPGFNRLWFRAMGLGPDGKIYVSGPGTTQHLHTIHSPDSSGLDCRVGLHDIELPAYTFSTMPNFPNHRLGPVDGSPCDTLGLNNLPLARFRHTGSDLGKQFLDLSAYEPTDWEWDFGDGNSSVQQQPYHQYQEKGIYKVCLTVSNAFGTGSTCRSVWVDTTFTTNTSIDFVSPVRFFPSPSAGHLQLKAPQEYFPCDLIIESISGKQLKNITDITQETSLFTFGDLPAGTYVLKLTKNGTILWQDHWVKVGK